MEGLTREALLLTLLELKDFPISPYELAKEILMFAAALVGVFFFIALRLNSLVEGSILNPLNEILGVVGRVREGDFSTRIKVFSNDEIGDLGDAGNRMIRGLSERERIEKGKIPGPCQKNRLWRLRDFPKRWLRIRCLPKTGKPDLKRPAGSVGPLKKYVVEFLYRFHPVKCHTLDGSRPFKIAFGQDAP